MENVLFICGVLEIILFFKIWGMTNNVAKIRRIINLNNRISFFNKLPKKCQTLRTNEVYYVRGIYEDKIFCVVNEDDETAIEFDANEIVFMEE